MRSRIVHECSPRLRRYGNLEDWMMENKCKVNGPDIAMCPALAEVTQGEIGDIKTQTRFRISDKKVRVAVFAGRFKKNMVELNYCPFCGGDIWTKYGAGEQAND